MLGIMYLTSVRQGGLYEQYKRKNIGNILGYVFKAGLYHSINKGYMQAGRDQGKLRLLPF
jgi:hypothetical protein